MFNKRSKGIGLLLLLTFLGAIVGSLVGEIVGKNDMFKWMAEGVFLPFAFSFGLSFFKLALDGALKANIMCLIGVITAVILYIKL